MKKKLSFLIVAFALVGILNSCEKGNSPEESESFYENLDINATDDDQQTRDVRKS